MKLKIERTVGEIWESFDMEGDYEEILALVTELGFCDKTPPIYNYHTTNSTVDPKMKQKIEDSMKPPYFVGGILNKQGE